MTTWPFVHASMLLWAFGVGVVAGGALLYWLLARWPGIGVKPPRATRPGRARAAGRRTR